MHCRRLLRCCQFAHALHLAAHHALRGRTSSGQRHNECFQLSNAGMWAICLSCPIEKQTWRHIEQQISCLWQGMMGGWLLAPFGAASQEQLAVLGK